MTPIVWPRTRAEKGDVAVTSTAVCTSTTIHRRRSQKNTPRVDCDTEPTTSYLQQRALGLLIFHREASFLWTRSSVCCKDAPLSKSAALALSAVDRMLWVRCHNRPAACFLVCVVVDVHTAVVVTATSPFSTHVRGHTIGVTVDRSVFFCLLLVCDYE